MENDYQWRVIQSPTDPEMYAVEGIYLVADNLPVEDADLIPAAPEMLEALESTPIIGRGEGFDAFQVRQTKWLQEVYNPAVRKARGQ